MKNLLRLILGALLAAGLTAQPKLTVLSTDIATDIDDTWALAHLLRSPELDLRFVLTETGEARHRAAVAAKLLEVAGRTDVDVGLGVDFGVMGEAERHQGPWVADYDLAAYPGTLHEDGVAAFIRLIEAAETEVTVIAIGPVPSLAEAVRRAPHIAAKCRLIGMHGSVDVGYGGSAEPAAEYNVANNVPAFRTVMAAAWKSIELTPLDTCGLVDLDGANYHAVWRATDDPLLRAVIENYCIWAPRVPWMTCDFFTQRSSTLFDDVAVYMAYASDLLEYETVRYDVTDAGFMRRDSTGPFEARFALRWRDLPAFERHLADRLTGRALP